MRKCKCLPVYFLNLFTGSAGLYFPQKSYSETIYIGQAAGTPVLQVHSMPESDSERPHFHLCRTMKAPYYSTWFHMDETTGVLSMNKTLEWNDFDSHCKLKIES